MLGIWAQLGIIAGGAVAVMVALYLVQRKHGDAGIVDVGWSYALGASAIFAGVTGTGDLGPRILIGVLGGLWGLRLGTHILTDRILKGIEDGRYQMFREKTGDRFQRFLLWFYLGQAGSVPILAVPFVLASTAPGPIGFFGVAAIVVFVIGLTGEFIADEQLKSFKRKPESKGKTCREGLWRYSRHPNYFFEWLLWVAYALAALAAPWGWVALFAPVLMLVLILKVTGIPPTEARAVRSRGDDYREYQRTTSPFFPLPPRPDSESKRELV
ncbi:MAG: DUF1295 domain-containing protein [Phycisphaerales bacterium JB037]